MATTFVPCLNTLEVGFLFSQADGSPAQNTWFVQRSAAWTPTLITAMLNGFISWFGTGDGTHSYKAFMTSNNSLVEATGRDMTTQNGFSIAINSGLPIAGTSGPPSADLGLTYSLTARTGFAGAAFRGRTFLIGAPRAFWSAPMDNLIDAAQVPGILAAFSSLVAKVAAVDSMAELVVCSRWHVITKGQPPVPRSAGIMTPVLSYGNHNLNTDFQRRRAPAHNRHR